MSFDDRLRDELRKATESQPLDADGALHRVKSTQPAPASPASAVEPSVVALEDVDLPRRRHVRTQRVVGVAAALALIAGAVAVPYALRDQGHNTAHRLTPHQVKTLKTAKPSKNEKPVLNPIALQAVASALNATTGAGSYHVAYTLHENPGTVTPTTECRPVYVGAGIVANDESTPPPSVGSNKDIGIVSGQGPTSPSGPLVGDGATRLPIGPSSPAGPPAASSPTQGTECFSESTVNNVTTSGTATVNVNPFAMEAVSNVSSFGPVTVQVDDTEYWETAGTGPTPTSGAGEPLSNFAGLVEGTLGPREGAGAMMGLSSPTGYLSIAREAIVGAVATGTGTVNGKPVTNYRVNVDPSLLASVPGLSSEESTTINAALAVLQAQGFTGNSTDVSVDANGFVVHTVSTNNFSNGGSVVSEDTFSDFGCAGAVQLPGRPAGAASSTCADTSIPTAKTSAGPPSTAPATTATSPCANACNPEVAGPTTTANSSTTLPSNGVAGPTTTGVGSQAP